MKYAYSVTGDFARITYSNHKTFKRAEKAARSLWRAWGRNHPGSEPRIVDNESGKTVDFNRKDLPGVVERRTK